MGEKCNPGLRNKVLNCIDNRQDDILDFVKNLVKIPSVIGYEKEAQDFIRKKLQKMGLETRLLIADKEVIKKHPGYCETPWDYDNRPNVIGILKGNGNGRSLILNGHIDVVTPGPMNLWKHNPWGAEVEKGKLFGRGAWDMKSGVGAMIYALQTIIEVGIELNGDVIIESVIEEEAGGSGGTLATILEGIYADAAIIPEPTGLKLWLASAGVNYFRIWVEGKTIHPMHVNSGVDAIEKALLIREALKELNARRRSEVRYELFEKEADYSCDLNVGKLKAGDWPSAIPGWAEMECRISFTPDEKMHEIKRLVERTVVERLRDDTWLQGHPPKVNWFGWTAEPSVQTPDHPLVNTVKRIAGEIFEIEPPYSGFPGGLDTRIFLNYAKIPSFCFGPRGGNIHGIDEFVIVDDIFKLTKVLACTMLEWCGH